MTTRTEFADVLVWSEIRKCVASAIEDGSHVCAPDAAATIIRRYPRLALDADEVTRELATAAAKAGVAVEFDRPHILPLK
jgi:hypothetical protein